MWAAEEATPKQDTYIVRAVVHAAQIIGAFREPGEILRLRDVVKRTRLRKVLCFRMLHTLQHCRMIEKVDTNGYRLVSGIGGRKPHRIGYATQGQDSSLPREVGLSVVNGRNPRGRR
jgi:hypothetical protein